MGSSSRDRDVRQDMSIEMNATRVVEHRVVEYPCPNCGVTVVRHDAIGSDGSFNCVHGHMCMPTIKPVTGE